MTTLRPCPGCGGSSAAAIHTQRFESVDGHPVGRGYDVVCCDTCGFAFADTACTAADLNRFYAAMSKYADSRSGSGAGVNPLDAARLRATARTIHDSVAPGARILDIGCANGGLLGALGDLGRHALAGVDPSAACVAATTSRGFEAHQATLDALPAFGRTFDCVVLSHVLEHVLDVGPAIAAALAVLAPGGRLYIEVPDAARYTAFLYSPFQDFNTEHINHFSESTLRGSLARLGLATVAMGHKTFRQSETCEFPAVYGFFERGAAVPPPESGGSLADRLARYTAASAALMDEIDRHLEAELDGRGCIVWGMGQLAMKVFCLPRAQSIPVAACVDSNPVNHGKLFRGAPIVPPDAIAGMSQPILITSLIHHRSIERQIESMGLPNRRIFLRPDPDTPYRALR